MIIPFPSTGSIFVLFVIARVLQPSKRSLRKRGMFVDIIEAVLEEFGDIISPYRAVSKCSKRFNHTSFCLTPTETMELFAPSVL